MKRLKKWLMQPIDAWIFARWWVAEGLGVDVFAVWWGCVSKKKVKNETCVDIYVQKIFGGALLPAIMISRSAILEYQYTLEPKWVYSLRLRWVLCGWLMNNFPFEKETSRVRLFWKSLERSHRSKGVTI